MSRIRTPLCICGSKKFDILIQGEYSFFTIEGKSVAFQALKCLHCGLVLTNPPPLEGFSDQHEIENELEDICYLESSKYRINRIQPYLNSSTKVLEIGCHTGLLVEMTKLHGVKESIGVEISSQAAAYGQKLGRDIRNMYLHECNFPSSYFDVIQAHHVLEHIPNFSETINEVFRILKPNGIFYVTVPRYNSVFVKSPNWMGWFPQEHFWHFTEKSLSNLLSQHKFKLFNYCCPLHSEHATTKEILYSVKRMVKFGVKKINLGDTFEGFFVKDVEG